jgi:hypothetical protein
MSVRCVIGALVGAALLVTGMFPHPAAPGEMAAITSAHAAPAKASKRHKKVHPQMALSNLLAEKSDGVQDCAVKQALNKGSNRVDIVTKVTINNRGQVIGLVTEVKVDKGDSSPVRDCVDKLIRSIQFPKNDAPLITIERNWSIQ